MTHDTSHPFWNCEEYINNMRCLAVIIHDYLSDGASIDDARQNALCHLSGHLLVNIDRIEAAWGEAFSDEGSDA